MGCSSIACGSESTAAVMSDGSLFVWGNAPYIASGHAAGGGPVPRCVLIQEREDSPPVKVQSVSCAANRLVCVTAAGRAFSMTPESERPMAIVPPRVFRRAGVHCALAAAGNEFAIVLVAAYGVSVSDAGAVQALGGGGAHVDENNCTIA